MSNFFHFHPFPYLLIIFEDLQPTETEQAHIQAGNLVLQGIALFEAGNNYQFNYFDKFRNSTSKLSHVLRSLGKFTESGSAFLQSVGILVNSSPQAYKLFPAEMAFAIRYAQVTYFIHVALSLLSFGRILAVKYIHNAYTSKVVEESSTIIHFSS